MRAGRPGWPPLEAVQVVGWGEVLWSGSAPGSAQLAVSRVDG